MISILYTPGIPIDRSPRPVIRNRGIRNASLASPHPSRQSLALSVDGLAICVANLNQSIRAQVLAALGWGCMDEWVGLGQRLGVIECRYPMGIEGIPRGRGWERSGDEACVCGVGVRCAGISVDVCVWSG